jgi:hypothetical protein
MLSFCECTNEVEQAHFLSAIGVAREGERAGFCVEEMIEMLNSGMGVEDLLKLITCRLGQSSQRHELRELPD